MSQTKAQLIGSFVDTSNAPVLIGTATSTGTVNQVLQVSGGGYISGNLGIGTTNPQSKLDVVGDVNISGNLLFNSGYGSTAVAYGCRAWVNFNGTTASPSTIRASGNVSSVTKNGTGDYTVNFTTAMVDANYSAVAGGNCTGATITVAQPNSNSSFAYAAPTTSACRLLFSNNTGTKDIDVCNVAIFR